MTPPLLTGLAVALLGSLTACVSPVAMHRAILEYDRTVSQVDAEILLLNLARARHQRPLHFTVTSNVAATFEFRTTAGIVGEPLGGTVPGLLRPIAGISMAESPTVAIVPVQGEEFTKRILAPIDETKFEFLEHRGLDLALLLRLVASEIIMNRNDSDIPIVLPNSPRHLEEYREFRRRVLHLSSLHRQHELHINPLLYEETWPLAPEHPLTAQALHQGYRWSQDSPDQKPLLTRQVTGRLAMTNYDVARLPNEVRRRLHDEAERYPRDQVLVDIRPGFPGGDYPLHGRIQLRSFEAMLRFLAGSPDELPEFDVEPDTRTGPMPGSPPRTLELFETAAPPRDAAVAVEFEGRWYSIRKASEDLQRPQGWNLLVFRVLSHVFQLTVTDISQKPTFPIAIAK